MYVPSPLLLAMYSSLPMHHEWFNNIYPLRRRCLSEMCSSDETRLEIQNSDTNQEVLVGMTQEGEGHHQGKNGCYPA